MQRLRFSKCDAINCNGARVLAGSTLSDTANLTLAWTSNDVKFVYILHWCAFDYFYKIDYGSVFGRVSSLEPIFNIEKQFSAHRISKKKSLQSCACASCVSKIVKYEK